MCNIYNHVDTKFAWLLRNVSDVIVFSNSLATYLEIYGCWGLYSIVTAQQIIIDELVIIDY